jgi:DNA-binding transcriptional regulator YdaS (Cro superfamily)
MRTLKAYLSGLEPAHRAAFAERCETTIGYLRKCISTGQKIGERICINLERESGRAVQVEDLRDDVDWAYIRASAARTEAPPARPARSNGHAAAAAEG